MANEMREIISDSLAAEGPFEVQKEASSRKRRPHGTTYEWHGVRNVGGR